MWISPTHVCRSKGAAVSQTASHFLSIGGGQVHDDSGRSVLHQALHRGPTQTGRPAGHQADHALPNVNMNTVTLMPAVTKSNKQNILKTK